MTISSTNRKAGPFIGNDSTTACPFAFKVFSATDLLVVQLDESTGLETELVLSTDYAVVLNADQNSNPGGTVTLASPIAVGFTITITSDIAELQPTDLTNQGGFYPKVITNALDRLTILVQQLSEKMGRTLKLAISTPAGVDTTLPVPTASQLIGWNPSATALQNIDPGTLATIVSYGTSIPDLFTGDGVTATFALTYNPGAIGNLDVSIGTATQRNGIDFTWDGGLNVTFTTAPPAPATPGDKNILVRYMRGLPQGSSDGAATSFVQTGTGSLLRNVQDKMREGETSVSDKTGADLTGVADSTTSAQNALNSGVEIFLPAGTYKLGQLTVPAGVRRIRGAGVGKTIINATGVISGAGLFNLSGLSNVEICGMTINMPAASYPAGWAISLTSCTDCYIHDVAIPQAPAAGVRGDTCTGVTVKRCSIIGWTTMGISFVGANNRIRVLGNYVPGSGTQTSHNIQVMGGGTHEIKGNFTSNNTTGFGANLFNCNGGVMQGNVHFGSQIEGYNVQNCSNVSIDGNVVVYGGATSSDFGISVYGENLAGTCYNVKVSNNIVVGSGKAGIALAQYCDGCSVTGNTVRNPNRLNQSQWGGITLYGFGCNGNYVGENFIYSSDGLVKYAVNEWNDGTGSPDANVIKDNTVLTTGSLTSEIALTGANSLAYMLRWSPFTPTVSATSGSISSYTVNSAAYLLRGKRVDLRFDISITNAGTGSGGLTVLWPGVPNAKTNAGFIYGKETGVSGKMCGGIANSGGAVINDYSAATVIATGSRVVCSGSFEAS